MSINGSQGKSMTVVFCEIGETPDEGLRRYKTEHGEDAILNGVVVVSFVSPGEATGDYGFVGD